MKGMMKKGRKAGGRVRGLPRGRVNRGDGGSRGNMRKSGRTHDSGASSGRAVDSMPSGDLA